MQRKTVKICYCCNQRLYSSFVVLLEAILQRCSFHTGGVNLPVSNKCTKALIFLCLTNTLGINLPVFNKYTVALICLCLTKYLIHWGINLPVANKYTGALICLCLTNTQGH